MAITLDGSVYTSNNTATKSITVANNSNRLLIVSFVTYQGGAPSGITYNGDSLTKIAEEIGSYGENCSIWGLVAPYVGTANVVVSGAGNWFGFGVYSLYNCSQTLPHNYSVAQGDSSTASCALTTGHDNSWVIACIESEPDPTMTTSGGTADWELAGESYQHGSGQHILKATAGSQTMSASLGYGARWNQCNVEVELAVDSTSIKDLIQSGIIAFSR